MSLKNSFYILISRCFSPFLYQPSWYCFVLRWINYSCTLDYSRSYPVCQLPLTYLTTPDSWTMWSCMMNIVILYDLHHSVCPNPYPWSDLIVSVELCFAKNISKQQKRYCSVTLCKKCVLAHFRPQITHFRKNTQIVTEAAHAKILTDCEVWRLFSDLLPQYWERYWVFSCPTRIWS